MKARRVRVLGRAQRDVEEIVRYVAADVPDRSERLSARLLDAMEGLSELAERGARPRDEYLRRLDYRFLVVHEYLIFYKVLRAEVRIYRVLHGRRKLVGWL